MMMEKGSGFTRTRIAPTPSGYLHVGNILSFSLTVALARRAGASVLLRIDDLDQDRVKHEYLADIFETLRFLEIPWDEGPADVEHFEREYSQLRRMRMYECMLDSLKERGLVYACTCSRAQLRDGIYAGTCRDLQLPLDSHDASWRLRTSPTAAVRVNTWERGETDEVLPEKAWSGRIVETVLPAGMQDFVVRKKDGFPAYQLTSLVDDIYYGVDLVIRGADLWPSTVAQHYLASCMPGMERFREAMFYHHPLLVGPDGGKLSKSAGATSIRYMRGQGMKAEDIYHYIAGLLGRDVAVPGWKELAELVVGMI